MWRHNFSTDRVDFQSFRGRCDYCHSDQISISVPNYWPLNSTLLRAEHERWVDALSEHVEDTYADHREIISDFQLVDDVEFRLCPVCGWWGFIQQIDYSTPAQPYVALNWVGGCLHNSLSSRIEADVDTIRKVLSADYERRFFVDPHIMEEVVESVFRSLGYSVEISQATHDGGIDIFGLDKAGSPFGVQVKRYRNKVRIEEIRSFLGALLLNGMASGVFVTTSRFTNGAARLRNDARLAGIELDYVDADHLLEMIKAAQLKDFDVATVPSLAEEYASQVPELSYGTCFHLNSL